MMASQVRPNLVQTVRRGAYVLLAALSAGQSVVQANDLDTGFEFPESTESFVLGTSPRAVFFDGAESVFLGIASDLHHTGFYTWAALPGATATATFETPAESITLFSRREDSQTQGILQMLDVDGNVVFEVVPPDDDFIEYSRPSGAPPIAQVRMLNTGSAGLLVIDDVTYCAVTDDVAVGTEFCSPANPNSSGAPATIRATGSSFVLAGNLTLRAEQVPSNVFGFFLTSTSQGFVANPGGSQGNLCLSGGIGRFAGPGQILNSGAAGTLELKIDLTQQPTPGGFTSVMAGDTWNFQAWTRDTVGGVPTSNLTSGLEVRFF